MNYKIKMMSKDEIIITQEEYQRIISSKAKGLVFIERLKGSLNLNSVESILPEDMVTKEQTTGRLHDGTRVVKQFGVWKDANYPETRFSPEHYPEIANDTVMTEKEYCNQLTGLHQTHHKAIGGV